MKTSRNVEELTKLVAEVFGDMYPWPSYTTEQIQERFDLHTDFIVQFVIVKRKRVGFAIGHRAKDIATKKDYMYLWLFGLTADQRGKGFGAAALQRFENKARKNGYREIRVKTYNVNRKMLLLLLKRGYHIFYAAPNKKGYGHNSLYNEVGLLKRV